MNAAVNNAIERESKLKRKISIIVTVDEIYRSENTDIQSTNSNKILKNKIKTNIALNTSTRNIDKLDTLSVQGGYLHYLEKEKIDPEWKGFIFNLKKGTMKFILNSSINTLATQNNLKRWNKSFSDKCLICKNKDSILHCLNGCKTMLNQNRYTWRHDNILKYINDNINDSKLNIYTDIKSSQTLNGGTIPPNLIVTPLRPDIVILDGNKANIFELTVPFETNIESRHKFKMNKYAHLCTDIKTMSVSLEAFEIGSRGLITPENKLRLRKIYTFVDKSITFKTFTNKISEIAITSSYYIYLQRKNPQWVSPGPIFS